MILVHFQGNPFSITVIQVYAPATKAKEAEVERSMNQGKLDVVKQKTARVNIDILGISELNWMVKGKFNSDDHYIHYCRQESLRRNGVALIISKRI